MFGTISTESALSVDDEQDPLLYLGVKTAGSTWEHSISLLGVARGAGTPVNTPSVWWQISSTTGAGAGGSTGTIEGELDLLELELVTLDFELFLEFESAFCSERIQKVFILNSF